MDVTKNYALNQPATQSSVSPWSCGVDPDDDAGHGNNGALEVDFGSHTASQQNPWWQVDLGDDIVIEKIVLYNRIECAFRMRYFSISASLNGTTWQRIFSHADDVAFGLDGAPMIAMPATPVLARFVRVQLDYWEFLHFRECEVHGRLPSEADYEILERESALQAARRREFVAGRDGFLAKLGHHILYADTKTYSSTIIWALRDLTYELDERLIVQQVLRSTDRVLEIGTAIGAVTMVIADRIGAANVLSFDGNPKMVADAAKNFVYNGFESIQVVNAVLKNRKTFRRSPKVAKFYVARDFWASRLSKGQPLAVPPADIVEVLDVPVLCLEDQIKAHRANVLVMDIEGGEIALLRRADLKGVNLIIMETHFWESPNKRTHKMIRRLLRGGYDIDLKVSRFGVVVLRRRRFDPLVMLAFLPKPARGPVRRFFERLPGGPPALPASPD